MHQVVAIQSERDRITLKMKTSRALACFVKECVPLGEEYN